MRKAKLVVTFTQAPSYDVRIGAQALTSLGSSLVQMTSVQQSATRALLLADRSASEDALIAAKTSLTSAGFRLMTIRVSPDDALETAAELWRVLAQAGLDVPSLVVALGDTPLLQLAGFVGTAFGGGLPCVYAPTTLDAAVQKAVSDEAIFDVPGSKGLVKAELRPLYSCIDLDCFTGLTSDQWLQGFGFFAQAALLDSDDFFFWLSDNAGSLRNRTPDAVCEALVRTLGFRAALSSRVEQGDASVWDCLSYGREFAQAAQRSLAEGMRFSALLSQFKGLLSEEIVRAQDVLLARLGFIQTRGIQPVSVLEALREEARGEAGFIKLMLPSDIGRCAVVQVPEDEVLSCLEVL